MPGAVTRMSGCVCSVASTEVGIVHLRQTEIEHLHETAPRLNQVGALDVAVSDAAAVRLVERVGDLRGDVQRLGDRQRPARDALRDQLALDVLHGDEHRVLVLDEVVGDGDVRRLQERRGLRLAKQPGAAVGVAPAIGRQELQRDLASEPPVLGDVDFAHAARAEPWADVIVQDAWCPSGSPSPRQSQFVIAPLSRPLDALMLRVRLPPCYDSTLCSLTGQTVDSDGRPTSSSGVWASGPRSVSSSASRSAPAFSARRRSSRRASRIRSLMLAVWVLGGLISLCGALSVAELAASLPQTGGWYRLPARRLGTAGGVSVRLVRAGADSRLGHRRDRHGVQRVPAALARLRPRHDRLTNIIAAAAIVFAAVVNIRGAQVGAAFAGVSTVAKFGALGLLMLAAFLVGGPGASFANFASSAHRCRCRGCSAWRSSRCSGPTTASPTSRSPPAR